MVKKYKVTFISQNRPPQCELDPAYPDGKIIDTGKRPSCRFELPYPAECVGTWMVQCHDCGFIAAVTAAGRPDDPKAVVVPCKGKYDA